VGSVFIFSIFYFEFRDLTFLSSTNKEFDHCFFIQFDVTMLVMNQVLMVGFLLDKDVGTLTQTLNSSDCIRNKEQC
jgi:hypothetical protein